MLCAFGASAAAADLTGYLVLTSDYVWRGVTQSEGNPAVQLGGDVNFASGVYAGAWGSTVDIDNGAGRLRDTEVVYYLGYRRDAWRRWTLGVSAIAYTYPGQSGVVDYDYEEIMLSANFDDRLWFEYAYSPDLYQTGLDTHNFEVLTEFPAGEHLVAGIAAGYYDVSSFSGSGYAYWEAGVTWPFNRVDLDLRYHDTSRWVPVVSSPERAEPRVAFSIRVTF